MVENGFVPICVVRGVALAAANKEVGVDHSSDLPRSGCGFNEREAS